MTTATRQRTDQMSPDELRASGEVIFGYGWQTRLSLHYGVAARTVRRWAAGTAPVPSAIAANIRELVALRPPDASHPADGRDDAAFVALEPQFDKLALQAMHVGWHEAEIVTAALNWAITHGRDGAGIAPMIELLRGAIKTLQAERDT